MENKQETVQILYDAIKEYGLVTVLHKTLVGNFNVQIPLTQAACDLTIDEADFSVRSTNCLKGAGIKTILELVEAEKSYKLLMIRNLGTKSLTEIKTRLLCIGYSYLSEKGKKEFLSDLVEYNSSLIKLDEIE